MNNFKKLKFQSAVLGAKITSKLLKWFSKSSGTSLPGIVAFKLDKDFLSNIAYFCDKKIITITGTNGKTTTSGLIATILNEYHQKVLHNQQGANMPQGIAAALAVGLKTNKKADYFVLETDEAYLENIYSKLNADYLVITNLFNDQMDRHGGTNSIAKKIKTAIDKNPNLEIVLNADDVMLKTLYTKNTITYGFNKIELDKDLKLSPQDTNTIYCTCGQKLDFSQKFYAHIGHYQCPCGYKRPTPKINANAKILADKTLMEIEYNSKKLEISIKLCGIYNAYNALAAIAIALELGIDAQTIQNAFDKFNSSFGRANKIKFNDKNLYIQMIKNPAGATEGIKIANIDNNSNILIMINDEYSDGRDLSWLWDVDFSILKNYSNKIFVSGKRANDIALSLKYCDFPVNKIIIEENIETALNLALENTTKENTLYALPCYSAMVELKEILTKINAI